MLFTLQVHMGRCVYSCDNDVCDHQMVNMEFDSGATAVMTMNAFTIDQRRETRICGTQGELRWDVVLIGQFKSSCLPRKKEKKYFQISLHLLSSYKRSWWGRLFPYECSNEGNSSLMILHCSRLMLCSHSHHIKLFLRLKNQGWIKQLKSM